MQKESWDLLLYQYLLLKINQTLVLIPYPATEVFIKPYRYQFLVFCFPRLIHEIDSMHYVFQCDK